MKLLVLLLCVASASAAWVESSQVDTLTAPAHVTEKSPLFLESDNVLGFNSEHYEALKSHLDQNQEFAMENFVEAGGAPFVLKAYTVFAENAQLITMHADGSSSSSEVPDMVHLAGSVSSDPSSFVLLSVSPRGSTGIVRTGGKSLSVEDGLQGHAMLVEAGADGDRENLDKKEAEDENSTPDTVFRPINAPGLMMADSEVTASKWVLGVAVECDKKCNDLIKSAGKDPTNYLGALIAGTSFIYKRDLGRGLKIDFLRLWDRVSPFDRGTASLDDLKAKYQNNKFDIVHLFTGIREGGLAYVGTACRGGRGYNTGVSSIRARWKGEQAKSGYNWDLIVTAHEMGHNVGSGHSHDYSPPIDECVACPGNRRGSCGGSAARPVSRQDRRCVEGTIMSYCHLCGGTANVAMKFHPRAIEKIKATLNNHCGTLSGKPPSDGGPTQTVAPAPTPGPGGCTDQNPGWCARIVKSYPECQVNVRVGGGTKPLSEFCAKSCTGCGNARPTSPPTSPPTSRGTTPRATPAPAPPSGAVDCSKLKTRRACKAKKKSGCEYVKKQGCISSSSLVNELRGMLDDRLEEWAEN